MTERSRQRLRGKLKLKGGNRIGPDKLNSRDWLTNKESRRSRTEEDRLMWQIEVKGRG